MEKQNTRATKNSFPGVLWLLPIIFGLFGGVIAALIASLKYQASWWELAAVGVIVSTLEIIVYLLFLATLLSSI